MGHFIEPFTNTQSTDIWPWWYFAVAKKNFLITLIYTHPLINWHSYYKTLSQELRVLWIKLWIAFKYKDINHKHFKHQPPTNVQPLCVVIIPGQSPQCRFSSSLTHTQLLLFLVEIYHEKKIRFYLLFFFKFKLINMSDQLNKPFFWAILITCVQIMPFEQTGWGREFFFFFWGGIRWQKTPVNSKQHWPRLNTAPSDLCTQWTMGLCNCVAYLVWLLSVKLETLLKSKSKFYLNRSSDSLNNNNHMSSNRITPVLIRTYSDLIWNHTELLIFR